MTQPLSGLRSTVVVSGERFTAVMKRPDGEQENIPPSMRAAATDNKTVFFIFFVLCPISFYNVISCLKGSSADDGPTYIRNVPGSTTNLSCLMSKNEKAPASNVTETCFVSPFFRKTFS